MTSLRFYNRNFDVAMVCFGWLPSCWRFGRKVAPEPVLEEKKAQPVSGSTSPATRTPQSPRSAASPAPSWSSRKEALEATQPLEPQVDLFDMPMVPVAAFLTLADVVRSLYVCKASHAALMVGDKLLLPFLAHTKESIADPEVVINHISLPHVLVTRFVGYRLALDALKKAVKATPDRLGLRQLQRFVAKGCHVHAHDMAFLHTVLNQGQVSLLNLEKNMLSCEVVEELVNAVLLKDDKVETVCLRWNKIGNRGATSLATLHSHPTMTVLNLKTNCVGQAGAEALARMVARNPVLQVLNLRAQVPRLPNSVAISFAEALRTNGHLRRLKLRRNKINCDGAEALADALQSGPASRSLIELDLQQNYLKTRGGTALTTLLSVNKHLEVVFAGGNTFGRGELLEAIGELDLDPRLELAIMDDV